MQICIALISMVFPLIGLPLGIYGLYKDYRNWYIYILCVALFFSAWAYTYNPITNTDLVRYFDYINSISNMSLTEAFDFGIYGSGSQMLFGFVMMCWIFSQIGDPHLIAAFTIFVIYYVGLKITCQIGADYAISINKIVTHVIFFVFISNFFAITNNIRNVFAFSLITLAVFRECYENKKNILTYFLYLFPLFVHPSTIVLLVMRLFISFRAKIQYFLSFSLLFSYYLVGFVFNLNLFSFIGDNPIIRVLNQILVKAYNYFYDTTSEWGLIVAASPSEYLFKVFYVGIALVIAVYALLVLIKNEKEKDTSFLKISKLVNYELYLCFLTIACVPMLRPEYWRFAAISLVCSSPVLLLGDTYCKDCLYFNQFFGVRFLFVPACFALWLRNLLLSSDIADMLINFIISSPIIVFVIDFINIFY